jgi:hypothetical protein
VGTALGLADTYAEEPAGGSLSAGNGCALEALAAVFTADGDEHNHQPGRPGHREAHGSDQDQG